MTLATFCTMKTIFLKYLWEYEALLYVISCFNSISSDISVEAGVGLNLVNGCEPPTLTYLSLAGCLVPNGALLVPTTATQNNKH